MRIQDVKPCSSGSKHSTCELLMHTSPRKEILAMGKVVENRSLGYLRSALRALKKRHDNLYEEHQKTTGSSWSMELEAGRKGKGCIG